MWYFSWVLGLAFAAFFSVTISMWYENREDANKKK